MRASVRVASLRFLSKKMPTHRGFFYHWAEPENRRKDLGLGSIFR